MAEPIFRILPPMSALYSSFVQSINLPKIDCFTGSALPDVLHKNKLLGMDHPRPACVRSIHVISMAADTAFSKGCHLTEIPPCF